MNLCNQRILRAYYTRLRCTPVHSQTGPPCIIKLKIFSRALLCPFSRFFMLSYTLSQTWLRL